VFEEVFLNFLPVGHTHCDNDQVGFLKLSYLVVIFGWQDEGNKESLAIIIMLLALNVTTALFSYFYSSGRAITLLDNA
jgi:hypothetical protein